jgi:hypothetical protein
MGTVCSSKYWCPPTGVKHGVVTDTTKFWTKYFVVFIVNFQSSHKWVSFTFIRIKTHITESPERTLGRVLLTIFLVNK